MQKLQIRNIARRILEFFHVPAYTKERVFNVDFQVEIENIRADEKRFFLVAPKARSFASQELLIDPKFDPPTENIRRDERYGNEYAVWSVALKGAEKKKFTESFRVRVFPSGYNLRKAGNISSYASIDESIYLCASKYVCASDKEVYDLAQQLRASSDNIHKVLFSINAFVTSRLKYGDPIRGLYTTREALEKDAVDCGGFSTLMVALSIACGIPARIVCGYLAGYENNTMHAWVQVMLPNGQWVSADPSMEKLYLEGRTKKSGRLGYVGSDRIIFSVGCDMPLEINEKLVSMDILQTPSVVPKEAEKDLRITTTISTI